MIAARLLMRVATPMMSCHHKPSELPMERLSTGRPDANDAAMLSMSPIETDRIRALATRALEGAPALTPGEVRELAGAVLAHNDRFARS